MFDNPIVLVSLMCLCFPGIIPIVITFFVARNFDINVKKRALKPEDLDV